MPELPEVETVRRTLEHKIIGEKIINVEVYCQRIIGDTKYELFKQKLLGQTLKKIMRYGKYLFFIFDNVSIISHLRMEGKYFIKDVKEPLAKHEHIVFTFESLKTLRYHDTRKFGTMKLVDTTDFEILLREPEIAKLGMEANNPQYSKEMLYKKLHNKKEPIKTALLNQDIICGMGNIYVDEVCFLSNIHPLKPACNVTLYECEKILNNAAIVLNNAILAGGTTIRSYTSSLGVTGRFQLNLNVHTKSGSPCLKCNTIVEKIRVGGRGTYFCPTCQKEQYPIIIGITGGIASGKSTVSSYIKSLGYLVIDADVISRELTSKEEVLNKIKEEFGDSYFDDNMLNRKKLGNAIFEDCILRKKLNDIIHPRVKKEIINQILEDSKNLDMRLIFIDVPLLFETNFDYLCNKTICVYTNDDTNLKRLMKRDNIGIDAANKKIASQLSLKEKCEKADFIIDNSFDLCYTYKIADEIIDKIKSNYKI